MYVTLSQKVFQMKYGEEITTTQNHTPEITEYSLSNLTQPNDKTKVWHYPAFFHKLRIIIGLNKRWQTTQKADLG
jgi:hypothetical protein